MDAHQDNPADPATQTLTATPSAADQSGDHDPKPSCSHPANPSGNGQTPIFERRPQQSPVEAGIRVPPVPANHSPLPQPSGSPVPPRSGGHQSQTRLLPACSPAIQPYEIHQPLVSETEASSEPVQPNASQSDRTQANPQPEPSETLQPEPSETLQPEPEPSETLQPEPSETLQPEPSETLQPEPSETLQPEPSETLQPEPSETLHPVSKAPRAHEGRSESAHGCARAQSGHHGPEDGLLLGVPQLSGTLQSQSPETLRPHPSGTLQPQPSRTLRPQPSGTLHPQPSGTLQPEPSGTLHPQPSGTLRPHPSGTLQPQPSGTLRPQPSGTLLPQPSGTLHPQPSGTLQPEQSGTLDPKPSGTFHPQQSGTLQLEPSGTLHPQPSGTLWPEPSGTLHPQPSGTLQPEPSGTLHPQPSGTLHPQPSGTLHPQPSGTLYPQPSGTLQARLPSASQFQSNGSGQGRPPVNNQRDSTQRSQALLFAIEPSQIASLSRQRKLRLRFINPPVENASLPFEWTGDRELHVYHQTIQIMIKQLYGPYLYGDQPCPRAKVSDDQAPPGDGVSQTLRKPVVSDAQNSAFLTQVASGIHLLPWPPGSDSDYSSLDEDDGRLSVKALRKKFKRSSPMRDWLKRRLQARAVVSRVKGEQWKAKIAEFKQQLLSQVTRQLRKPRLVTRLTKRAVSTRGVTKMMWSVISPGEPSSPRHTSSMASTDSSGDENHVGNKSVSLSQQSSLRDARRPLSRSNSLPAYMEHLEDMNRRQHEGRSQGPHKRDSRLRSNSESPTKPKKLKHPSGDSSGGEHEAAGIARAGQSQNDKDSRQIKNVQNISSVQSIFQHEPAGPPETRRFEHFPYRNVSSQSQHEAVSQPPTARDSGSHDNTEPVTHSPCDVFVRSATFGSVDEQEDFISLPRTRSTSSPVIEEHPVFTLSPSTSSVLPGSPTRLAGKTDIINKNNTPSGPPTDTHSAVERNGKYLCPQREADGKNPAKSPLNTLKPLKDTIPASTARFQRTKAIGPTLPAVGLRTAVRGPTAADVGPMTFCALGLSNTFHGDTLRIKWKSQETSVNRIDPHVSLGVLPRTTDTKISVGLQPTTATTVMIPCNMVTIHSSPSSKSPQQDAPTETTSTWSRDDLSKAGTSFAGEMPPVGPAGQKSAHAMAAPRYVGLETVAALTALLPRTHVFRAVPQRLSANATTMHVATETAERSSVVKLSDCTDLLPAAFRVSCSVISTDSSINSKCMGTRDHPSDICNPAEPVCENDQTSDTQSTRVPDSLQGKSGSCMTKAECTSTESAESNPPSNSTHVPSHRNIRGTFPQHVLSELEAGRPLSRSHSVPTHMEHMGGGTATSRSRSARKRGSKVRWSSESPSMCKRSRNFSGDGSVNTQHQARDAQHVNPEQHTDSADKSVAAVQPVFLPTSALPAKTTTSEHIRVSEHGTMDTHDPISGQRFVPVNTTVASLVVATQTNTKLHIVDRPAQIPNTETYFHKSHVPISKTSSAPRRPQWARSQPCAGPQWPPWARGGFLMGVEAPGEEQSEERTETHTARPEPAPTTDKATLTSTDIESPACTDPTLHGVLAAHMPKASPAYSDISSDSSQSETEESFGAFYHTHACPDQRNQPSSFSTVPRENEQYTGAITDHLSALHIPDTLPEDPITTLPEADKLYTASVNQASNISTAYRYPQEATDPTIELPVTPTESKAAMPEIQRNQSPDKPFAIKYDQEHGPIETGPAYAARRPSDEQQLDIIALAFPQEINNHKETQDSQDKHQDQTLSLPKVMQPFSPADRYTVDASRGFVSEAPDSIRTEENQCKKKVAYLVPPPQQQEEVHELLRTMGKVCDSATHTDADTVAASPRTPSQKAQDREEPDPLQALQEMLQQLHATPVQRPPQPSPSFRAENRCPSTKGSSLKMIAESTLGERQTFASTKSLVSQEAELCSVLESTDISSAPSHAELNHNSKSSSCPRRSQWARALSCASPLLPSWAEGSSSDWADASLFPDSRKDSVSTWAVSVTKGGSDLVPATMTDSVAEAKIGLVSDSGTDVINGIDSRSKSDVGSVPNGRPDPQTGIKSVSESGLLSVSEGGKGTFQDSETVERGIGSVRHCGVSLFTECGLGPVTDGETGSLSEQWIDSWLDSVPESRICSDLDTSSVQGSPTQSIFSQEYHVTQQQVHTEYDKENYSTDVDSETLLCNAAWASESTQHAQIQSQTTAHGGQHLSHFTSALAHPATTPGLSVAMAVGNGHLAISATHSPKSQATGLGPVRNPLVNPLLLEATSTGGCTPKGVNEPTLQTPTNGVEELRIHRPAKPPRKTQPKKAAAKQTRRQSRQLKPNITPIHRQVLEARHLSKTMGDFPTPEVSSKDAMEGKDLQATPQFLSPPWSSAQPLFFPATSSPQHHDLPMLNFQTPEQE